MIDHSQPALVQQLFQTAGVSFEDLRTWEAPAQTLAELGIAFDDDHPAIRSDAAEQFGGNRPGAGPKFHNASGAVEVDALNHGLGQPTGTGNHGSDGSPLANELGEEQPPVGASQASVG